MAAIGGHGKRGKEKARTLAELLGEGRDLRGGRFAAEKDFSVAGKIFEAKVRQRAAEILRGDFFKLVRLVEDDSGGFRENAGVWRVAGGEADCGVGKEEVVIDDDEIGLEGAAAHFGDEAAAIVGAGAAEAGLGARVKLVPERAGFRQTGKLGAVAGFGDLLPLGDLAVFVDLVESRENRLVAEGEELAAAKIIGAALHVADAKLSEEGFKERNVAEEELILECFGSGGDDYALAGAECGQKIGERFASAGACFDDEMPALCECAFDGFGHFELAGAVLEGERRASEDSPGREKLMQRGESPS